MKTANPTRLRAIKPTRPNNGQTCHPLVPRGDSTVDRALLTLHGAQEMREFWDRTRRVLHAALPLDFVCLCLRPFVVMPSTVFRERAPFASENEFRRFQELNPIGAHLAAHPGSRLTRLSDVVPDHQLVQTEFFRRFLEPSDDRYFVSLNFWHGEAFQGLIGLHRTAAQRDFADSEIALLEQLYPHFATALQRILDIHRERAVRLSLEKLIVDLPIATILIDWDLHVVYRNRAAIEQCSIWLRGRDQTRMEKPGEEFEPPPQLLEYCREFKAKWQPAQHRCCPLTSTEGVTIQHPSIAGLRAAVNLLQLDAAPVSMPLFLVRLLDAPTLPARVAQENDVATGLFARLSRREREVALLTSQGHTNDEIARRLRKSSLTVKKQLCSIYQKLAVNGRGKLIALLR